MFARSVMRGATALGVALALTGCSAGSLTGTSTKGPTQSQVNSFMEQVANAYSNGMQSAHSAAPAEEFPVALGEGGWRAHPAAPNPMPKPFADGLPGGPERTLVNVSVSQRTNCTAGGNINVLGSMTGSLDDHGTGVLTTQVTETINSWQCIGGFVMDGDPYLSAAGTFSFLNGVQSSPATIDFGGGFKWSGNGSGSCNILLSMLLYANGSGTLSGTACNYQVYVSF